MDNDAVLREHLLNLLSGRGAHVDFDSVVAGFPVEGINQRPQGLPYSAWQVLEHMRIAQRDILEFIRSGDYVSPRWPEGYWPQEGAAGDAAAWKRSIESFREDLESVIALVRDTSTDLFARIPHGQGQTILREALLVADHNAYHLGAMVVIKRIVISGA